MAISIVLLPLNFYLKVRGIKGVISFIFITPLAPLIIRGVTLEKPGEI
jgi:hypothetical protein